MNGRSAYCEKSHTQYATQADIEGHNGATVKEQATQLHKG